MAKAMTLIDSQTLSGTSSSITFGSGGTLPQTYQDIRIVATILLSTNSTQSWIRLNGDTGANYLEVGTTGYSTSSTVAWNDTGATKFTTMRATGLASGNQQLLTIDLFDYTTSKYKALLSRTNHLGEISMLCGRWASTSAVTSITLLPETGTFAAGSTFYVYGVSA